MCRATQVLREAAARRGGRRPGHRQCRDRRADLTADDRRDAALAIEERGAAKVSLSDAMRFFLKNHASSGPTPATAEILAELIGELRTKGREPKYIGEPITKSTSKFGLQAATRLHEVGIASNRASAMAR